MLPCHGYPELKKYEHFYGHYGTAWQNQGKEFPAFPGAILMTTNCIQKPKGDSGDKMFTTGLVGWPGMPHIEADASGKKDFTPVIEKALSLPGFAEDADNGSVMVGFARKRGPGRGRQGHRGRQGRSHQALLPGGRLRRRQARPQLLHRVRGKGARRQRGADPGLRQVSASLTSSSATSAASRGFWTWASATTPTRPSRSPRPWQTPLTAASNDLPLSMILSWYEQKGLRHPADPVAPGHKGHPPGPHAARLYHPQRVAGAGGQLRHRGPSPPRMRT